MRKALQRFASFVVPFGRWAREMTPEKIQFWFFLSMGLGSLGLFIKVAQIMADTANNDFLEMNALDQKILVFIAGHRVDWLSAAAIDLTALGSVALLTLIFFVFMVAFIMLKDYLALAQLFFAGIGATGPTFVFKGLFERPRPSVVPMLIKVAGFSFPSGHSLAAATFYVSFAILAARRFRSWWEHALIYWLAGLVIALVACTRIYLGVHYPSDVLSGILLGSAWAFMSAAGTSFLGRWLSSKR